MFTKLRNKFLILNMIFTSTVMIAAFAIIYFITFSSMNKENLSKLNSQPNFQISIRGTGLLNDMEKGDTIINKVFTGDSLSFNIEVGPDGKILKINSFIDMPEEAYYKAAQTAWSNKKNNFPITIEGRKWQYVISQPSNQVIIGNNQKLTTVENKHQITFLDVTESNKTLFKLLTTLIIVGLIMLFVIFVISLYFANRAIKPIAETWEKQTQFVADASHELKTPLSIINANYDALLANKEETIISQLKWMEYIKIGTDRMTKLINDLLCLAKVEDVNLEIPKTQFNISKVINDVMLSMEALMIENNIKLSHSIESDVIVKGNLEKVKQVVSLLLDNAIKYSNKNGTIDISLIKSKHQVIYSIKNSGKGIAKQDLPKVFDRFYRGDPSRAQEIVGYGLGLSIAKTIINRLGGEINVTSVENEYTIFTFTL